LKKSALQPIASKCRPKRDRSGRDSCVARLERLAKAGDGGRRGETALGFAKKLNPGQELPLLLSFDFDSPILGAANGGVVGGKRFVSAKSFAVEPVGADACRSQS
jgi:hypothetical protein